MNATLQNAPIFRKQRKPATVHVLDSDLLMGCVQDSDNCPVSRAINRVLNGYVAIVGRVSVELRTYDLGRRLYIEQIPLPERAQDFIAAFDNAGIDAERFTDAEREELLAPFEFEIELPAECLAREAVLCG